MRRVTTNRAIGYIRVSGKRQGISGLGLEAQMAAIDSYARSSGCELVTTYQEVETGKRADRPQLLIALAHAKRLRAKLVIAKIDRLARNVAFVANLMESKVPFIACDMPEANELTIHIIAAVAQNEAKMISQRTKDGLAALKARGLYSNRLGRTVTLGNPAHLTREGALKGSKRGAAVVKKKRDEAYAYILPLIKEYRNLGYGYLSIANMLNENGEETRTGKAWNPTQVRRVALETRGMND